MHPHSNVNCKIWKDCKQNELQSVFVLSVLHFDVTKVNQVIFRIKRVNDDPDHDVRKAKGYKNLLGRVQYLTLFFFQCTSGWSNSKKVLYLFSNYDEVDGPADQ